MNLSLKSRLPLAPFLDMVMESVEKDEPVTLAENVKTLSQTVSGIG